MIKVISEHLDMYTAMISEQQALIIALYVIVALLYVALMISIITNTFLIKRINLFLRRERSHLMIAEAIKEAAD